MTARRRKRAARAALALALAATMPGCGGSSSTSSPSSSSSAPAPASNTVTVTVDGGPVAAVNNANVLYAQVTVCVPGTTTCQTIGHVQVDTGSSGLRLVSSALTLSLPRSSSTGGQPLAECLQYVDSSTWGTVRTADVKIGGETASSVPIQVIGDPAAPKVPSACTSGGFPTNDTQSDLGANGILGVGNYVEDCGPVCSTTGASNPGLYYECPSASTCRVAAVGLSQQVANPVAFFGADSNGVVITLPTVAQRAPTVSGTMTFGIGTQPNNALGSAKVFGLDAKGYLGTQLNGASLPYSFLDTGSDFLFFPDPKIPQCKDYDQLFCPASSVAMSATITATNGTTGVVPFTVDNADTQFKGSDSAFATVCGSSLVAGSTLAGGPGSFDWGLPFFYGRTVFTSIDGRSTPAGSDAFVAY